jgi:hypothetical protein
MTYDPLKRDSTWQMINPGCYIDPAGAAHLFPDEVVAELERQHPGMFDVNDPGDRQMVVDAFITAFRHDHPELALRFVLHERQLS